MPLNFHFFFAPSQLHVHSVSLLLPSPGSHGLDMDVQRNFYASCVDRHLGTELRHQAGSPRRLMKGSVWTGMLGWTLPPLFLQLQCSSCSCQGQCVIQDPVQVSRSLGRSFLPHAPATTTCSPEVSKHSTPGSNVRVCLHGSLPSPDCEILAFLRPTTVHLGGPQYKQGRPMAQNIADACGKSLRHTLEVP